MKIKKKNEKFFQFFLLSFLFCLTFLFIFSIYNIERKKRELREKILDLESKIQSLRERKEKLEAGILETQKGEYWEGLAREEGYVKEGEEAIVIKKFKENKEIKENLYQRIFENLKKIIGK